MALNRVRARRALVAAVGAVALLLPVTAEAAFSAQSVPAVPIPEDPGASTVAPFPGKPRPARPVRGVRFAPRHPFMAPNDRSNLHDDADQSDAGRTRGPLGRRPGVTSTLYTQECASVTFDAKGRILTVCVGLATVDLRLLDPRTLDVLAEYPLPPRPASSLSHPFTAFGGGGYFYLDHKDRAVVPTSDGHIDLIADTGTADAPQLSLKRQYDVSSYVGDSVILSVLPDWPGRLWFVTGSGWSAWSTPHPAPPGRRGCRTARPSATRSRSTRRGASSSSPTTPCTASARTGRAGPGSAGASRTTPARGRSRARASSAPARRRRSSGAGRATTSPSPTTPTRACTSWSTGRTGGSRGGRCARCRSSAAGGARPTTPSSRSATRSSSRTTTATPVRGRCHRPAPPTAAPRRRSQG